MSDLTYAESLRLERASHRQTNRALLALVEAVQALDRPASSDDIFRVRERLKEEAACAQAHLSSLTLRLSADPPSPVPATLRELLTDEFIENTATAFQDMYSVAICDALREIRDHKLGPAWDARERRIEQMTKEIEDVNNEVCGSQGVFFGHALKNIRAMKERDNQQYHELREAEAAREALREAAGTALILIRKCQLYGPADRAREAFDKLEQLLNALSPVPSSPRE